MPDPQANRTERLDPFSSRILRLGPKPLKAALDNPLKSAGASRCRGMPDSSPAGTIHLHATKFAIATGSRSTMDKPFSCVPHLGVDTRKAVSDTFDIGWIGMGATTQQFEKSLQTRLHTDRHVVATMTGTAALHLGLRLAGVGER
jgi:hypothetical protein